MIYLNENICTNCAHYYQHYTRMQDIHYWETIHGFTPVNCGHCVYPRIKLRRPDDTCQNFERR